MTLGLFVGTIALISVLWTIKLSQVLKKAEDADDKEKEENSLK